MGGRHASPRRGRRGEHLPNMASRMAPKAHAPAAERSGHFHRLCETVEAGRNNGAMIRVADLSDTSVRSRYERLGIVQYGAPELVKRSRRLQLPEEQPWARQIWGRLLRVSRKVRETHDFVHGTGLAAPQIGANRRIILLRFPDSAPLCMCNPKITSTSKETWQAFEGCLSFFDVRGLVTRPKKIEVRYQRLTGETVTASFEGWEARLVCHEVDHLDGVLYVDRMRLSDELLRPDQARRLEQRAA